MNARKGTTEIWESGSRRKCEEGIQGFGKWPKIGGGVGAEIGIFGVLTEIVDW
jgi:hypothetical protein